MAEDGDNAFTRASGGVLGTRSSEYAIDEKKVKEMQEKERRRIDFERQGKRIERNRKEIKKLRQIRGH